jgi:hypothetical protein
LFPLFESLHVLLPDRFLADDPDNHRQAPTAIDVKALISQEQPTMADKGRQAPTGRPPLGQKQTFGLKCLICCKNPNFLALPVRTPVRNQARGFIFVYPTD